MKQLSGNRRRQPFYRKRRFWGVVLFVVLAALAGGGYFLGQQDQQKPGEPTEQQLTVDTEPNEATIYIDGEEQGKKSDSTFEVKTGKHKVKVQLAGYDEHEAELEVFPTHAAAFFHRFTKAGQVETPSAQAAESFKTYTNQQYGYSIRIPADYVVDAESPNAVAFKDPKQPGGQEQGFLLRLVPRAHATGEEMAVLTVLVLPNPQNLPPEAWYKAREEYAMEDQSQIKQKTLTVNGQAAYQYETPYGFTPTLTTVLTGKGNAYLLQQIRGSTYRNIYEQLIATFKLT